MNIKRFIIAVIALFVFMYVYESYVHGVLLMNLYTETMSIWRKDMMSSPYMSFNISIMALLSIWITFIFTRLFKTGG